MSIDNRRINNDQKNIGFFTKSSRTMRHFIKKPADQIGINVSILRKIKNDERQLQTYIIKSIKNSFDIKYIKLHIRYINKYKIGI